MTVSEPMTRTELMELAALDALGLLDEYESALYTRSFHDASASVQDEIRELQAQIAVQLGQLCDEEPSPELRDRVLKAVSKAIELDSPAPLASIGRGMDYDPRFDGESSKRSADRDNTGPRRLALSGQFWRAACFVLMGVVLVCVFGMAQIWRSHHEVTLAALSNNTSEQIERQIGPVVKNYLRSPTAVRVVLSADGDACSDCWANVLMLEDSDQALLITEGLPDLEDGQAYQLRVRYEDGRTQVIDRITSGALLAGHRINVTASLAMANATWEIAGPDGVVLRGVRA
jgi:hypothetical protein